MRLSNPAGRECGISPTPDGSGHVHRWMLHWRDNGAPGRELDGALCLNCGAWLDQEDAQDMASNWESGEIT